MSVFGGGSAVDVVLGALVAGELVDAPRDT
jgi:hypothetical protein